jgi:hypothetical protein
MSHLDDRALGCIQIDVGEDVAALVGGTLLNLAARAISAQAVMPPEQREGVTLIVDEFHTIPGADYEQICGELAKYGVNLILATQTLSRLDTLTLAQQVRDLRAPVFSNLDGLFAFHTSAEDARYLAPELGGGLEEQDLLELGHFQFYARMSDMRTGERLPAFTVELDPPPRPDDTVAAELAEAPQSDTVVRCSTSSSIARPRSRASTAAVRGKASHWGLMDPAWTGQEPYPELAYRRRTERWWTQRFRRRAKKAS